jgi:DNA-binding transcriptional ArsR family regulator
MRIEFRPVADADASVESAEGRERRLPPHLTAGRAIHNPIVIERRGYAMTESERLDATFMALADPTRRAILARLARGEASVAELAEPFDMTQPAISRHLRVLERARLVSVTQDGQRRPRRLDAQPLAEASSWLERYRQMWEANFQRLDGLLEELQNRPRQRKATKRKTHGRSRR